MIPTFELQTYGNKLKLQHKHMFQHVDSKPDREATEKTLF